ncbi:MAG: hypothetical protein RL616_1381 [Verrucomicrobiota bacterium]|jgi:lysophospholipase L1-like esterase
MEIKIKAFGACMIGGFPHRPEDSFFNLALARLHSTTTHSLTPSIYTFGGFPVTRVPKHLKPRCLADHPDIVVIQFASSDLIVPIRRNHHRNQVSSVQRKVSTASPSMTDRVRWLARGIIGNALQLTSVTPAEIYLETMDQIVHAIAEHGAIPVVLSPFVFGGHRSDRIARNCVSPLEKIVSAIPKAYFVNAYAALAAQPRREMLLRDGSHLSLKGQAVVADSLFAALAKIVPALQPDAGR